MRRLAPAVVVAMSTSVLMLAGCVAGTPSSGTSSSSASSSNADLTQAQLLSRMQRAIDAEPAMHIKGTITDNGMTITVDMQLNRDGTSQGTMTTGKVVTPVIVVDGNLYTQAPASRAMGTSSPSGAMAGQWTETKAQGGALSATNFTVMAAELDAPSNYTYTYKDTSTIGGVAVARYAEAIPGAAADRVLSIPLTGAALPVAVDGGETGGISFTWGKPTKVVAPQLSQVVLAPASNA